MKDDQLPPQIAELVNERSAELINAFYAHRDQYINKNPDQSDSGIIYEGWAIQKIAGLQILLLLKVT